MLYKFQRELLNKIKTSYIIASGTGTGKTIMAIHHYLRHTNGEPLLIIAPPQKIIEGGWQRELETVANYYNVEISYDIVSYGVLSKKWQLYKNWFVVFDECHYVKNPTSQRGKAAIKLTKQSTNFLLLSATPASNGWEDTIAYMIMFGFYKNKTQFLREHAIYEKKYFGPSPVNVIVGWKNQKKLRQLYQSISIKLSKDEALDLPPIVFENVYFKPSKEYKTIEKERVLTVDGEQILFDNSMSLQHGLRFYANQKDKLAYTQMLAESTEENIVIFYCYPEEKEQILQSLK